MNYFFLIALGLCLTCLSSIEASNPASSSYIKLQSPFPLSDDQKSVELNLFSRFVLDLVGLHPGKGGNDWLQLPAANALMVLEGVRKDDVSDVDAPFLQSIFEKGTSLDLSSSTSSLLSSPQTADYFGTFSQGTAHVFSVSSDPEMASLANMNEELLAEHSNWHSLQVSSMLLKVPSHQTTPTAMDDADRALEWFRSFPSDLKLAKVDETHVSINDIAFSTSSPFLHEMIMFVQTVHQFEEESTPTWSMDNVPDWFAFVASSTPAWLKQVRHTKSAEVTLIVLDRVCAHVMAQLHDLYKGRVAMEIIAWNDGKELEKQLFHASFPIAATKPTVKLVRNLRSSNSTSYTVDQVASYHIGVAFLIVLALTIVAVAFSMMDMNEEGNTLLYRASAPAM